ncbi:superoxide dismutase, Fe-Mn family, partial [Phenoliferia sp. Uapishka_3]
MLASAVFITLASALAVSAKPLLPRDASGAANFQLFDLPYGVAALEPFISATTNTVHLTLLQGASAALRAQSALIETELAAPSTNLTAINEASTTIAKVTGALELHFIYFNSLAPVSSGGGDTSKASPEFAAQVYKDFGSFDNLIAALNTEVLAVPASGWGHLAYDTQVQALITTFTNDEQLLDAPLLPIIDVDIETNSVHPTLLSSSMLSSFVFLFALHFHLPLILRILPQLDTGANKTEYLSNLVHIYNWQFASSQFAAALKVTKGY